MPISTHRILAFTIPVKLAALVAFTWYATRPPAPQPEQLADQIVVVKSTHTMTLFAKGVPIHIYQVASFSRATTARLKGITSSTPATRTPASISRCMSLTPTPTTEPDRLPPTLPLVATL